MGSFLFRWPYPADHVYVTGTFDDWGKSERLEKVGEHFEKVVELPSSDLKIYYKFVVDDQWIVDENAPKEDDGHHNVNNVLLPSQITKQFPTKAVLAEEEAEASNLRSRIRATSNPSRVIATSHAPPGSNSLEGALIDAPIVSAGGEGAPLLSAEQSNANLARWIPHVTPDPNSPITRTLSKEESAPAKAASEAAMVSAGGVVAPLLSKEQSEANLAREISNVTLDPDRPVTRTLSKDETNLLPQTDGASASTEEDIPGAFPETPAGEPQSFSVDPVPATGHSDVQSSVTTSKEDYENAGGEGTAATGVSTLPVLPIGQKSLGDSATTSKEAYDKVGEDTSDPQVSVNPLPAEGHKDIQSSVTTSKEDYEKFGDNSDPQVSVNPLPADGHKDTQTSVTTSKEDYEKAGAIGAAGAAIAGAGAYLSGAFSKPKKDDKNIIPESSLPMNPEKTDTLDAGPFMSSSAGSGTTTANLASQVPLEPKREAQVVDPAADAKSDPAPFLASSGPGTTSADLASQVPLEPKRDATALNTAPEAPEVLKDANATPLISSSGPGTTTAALASQVPLEQKRPGIILDKESAPPAVAAEKTAVEEELLAKVPESQATGLPASAAAAQTSYYGLATTVPEAVEKSIAQAGTSPEAATDTSAVAEKTAMERELQAKIPVVESAGEPAPTLSAATATTAPGVASSTVPDLTDGKTANEPIPGTDTGSLAHGPSAGEIAGGAVVGGAAAAGAATLAAKHHDRDVEPPRIADSQKPDITTEAAPATQREDSVSSPVAGIGAASPHPGVSPIASAALSDGTEAADEPTPIQNKAPVETSEANATEYAPLRAGGLAPGVSPSAGAALSDGCEDPTLSEEPAVQMMKQNDNAGTAATSTAGPTSTESTATPAALPTASTVTPVHHATTAEKSVESATKSSAVDTSSSTPATGVSVPTNFDLGTTKPEAAEASTPSNATEPATPKKPTAVAGSSASTPVRGTPESSTTGDKKKKRHRLSAFIKKVFD